MDQNTTIWIGEFDSLNMIALVADIFIWIGVLYTEIY